MTTTEATTAPLRLRRRGTIRATTTRATMIRAIDGVGCVFSAEEARNPDFPFNLAGSSTSDDGKSLHVAADIYDSSGEERHEGEGVIHSIEIYDLDFENQTLHWRAETPFLGGDDSTFVTVDGKNIHGVGVFDDQTTDEIEELPGTLDLVCP
jgi:hypothetical protein